MSSYFIVTFGPAFLLAAIGCRFVMAWTPRDAPDGGRKRQAAPVPSAGGLAALPAAFAAWLAPLLGYVTLVGYPLGDYANTLAERWTLVWVLTFAVWLVGFLDDLGRAPTGAKLVLLAGACLAAAALGLRVEPSSLSPPLSILGSALWLFVMINVVNFMDGSNGLAMGSVAVMALGLFAAAASATLDAFELPLVALAGALAGFLVWNLQGRLYAGDTGAYAAGAMFAAVALWLIARGHLSLWTPPTIAAPFLIDTLLTLALRTRRRQPLLSPHRDHLYQRLIDTGWSHGSTARLYWALCAACSAAAWLSAKAGGLAPLMVFWVIVAQGALGWVVARRRIAAASEPVRTPG